MKGGEKTVDILKIVPDVTTAIADISKTIGMLGDVLADIKSGKSTTGGDIALAIVDIESDVNDIKALLADL